MSIWSDEPSRGRACKDGEEALTLPGESREVSLEEVTWAVCFKGRTTVGYKIKLRR